MFRSSQNQKVHSLVKLFVINIFNHTNYVGSNCVNFIKKKTASITLSFREKICVMQLAYQYSSSIQLQSEKTLTLSKTPDFFGGILIIYQQCIIKDKYALADDEMYTKSNIHEIYSIPIKSNMKNNFSQRRR